MPKGELKAIYVVSTHWDREWYEPFQHYRYHLVEVMDECRLAGAVSITPG